MKRLAFAIPIAAIAAMLVIATNTVHEQATHGHASMYAIESADADIGEGGQLNAATIADSSAIQTVASEEVNAVATTVKTTIGLATKGGPADASFIAGLVLFAKNLS